MGNLFSGRPNNYPERKPTQNYGEFETPTGQKLQLCLGDLTHEDTTAIVNAANGWLMHGAGVAGAIRNMGGPVIMEQSRRIIAEIDEVATGEAVVTDAGWLWCKYVIHAVGPIWNGGKKGEPKQLEACVWNSFILAHNKRMASIAVPAIGSGIFGFPKPLCAEIMIKCALKFFKDYPRSRLRLIKFTNFDKKTVYIFQQKFEELVAPLPEELKLPTPPPSPVRRRWKKQEDESELDPEEREMLRKLREMYNKEMEEEEKGKGKEKDQMDENSDRKDKGKQNTDDTEKSGDESEDQQTEKEAQIDKEVGDPGTEKQERTNESLVGNTEEEERQVSKESENAEQNTENSENDNQEDCNNTQNNAENSDDEEDNNDTDLREDSDKHPTSDDQTEEHNTPQGEDESPDSDQGE